MRIHRTARTRYFTSIGNEVLRDASLSFCARGILAYLLSLPDGQRVDIRMLTDRTPEGRQRVSVALRELEKRGYLQRPKTHTADGHIVTGFEVYDSLGEPPESSAETPDAHDAASGSATVGPCVDQPVKKQTERTTTHPAPRVERATERNRRLGREGAVAPAKAAGDHVVDEATLASASLLARVARADPRLPLGQRDALRLAPLVTEWKRRGASDLHIIGALTAGLPSTVHHPARFIETRLTLKMPAEPAIAPPRLECDECQRPVPAAGLCHKCRETSTAAPSSDPERTPHQLRGPALARAALHGLRIDSATLIPAPRHA